MFFGGNVGGNNMPKIIAKMSLRQIDRLPPGLHAVAAGGLYIAIGATGSRSWIFRYHDRRPQARLRPWFLS
jgi:hypothetical protein